MRTRGSGVRCAVRQPERILLMQLPLASSQVALGAKFFIFVIFRGISRLRYSSSQWTCYCNSKTAVPQRSCLSKLEHICTKSVLEMSQVEDEAVPLIGEHLRWLVMIGSPSVRCGVVRGEVIQVGSTGRIVIVGLLRRSITCEDIVEAGLC